MKSRYLSRSIYFLAFAFALFTQVLSAQDTKPEPCPDVTILGPAADLKVNETGDYSVIVDSKGVFREMSYVWSAFGGEVSNGQGTTNAKIKKTGDDLLVYIRINGLRPRCERDYFEKRLDLTPPEAILLSRIIGPISEGVDDQVKSFVEATRINKKYIFWVIFGCQKKDMDSVENRRQSLLELFDNHGRLGHDSRVTFVTLEADEDFIEFWRTTANARPPIVEK